MFIDADQLSEEGLLRVSTVPLTSLPPLPLLQSFPELRNCGGRKTHSKVCCIVTIATRDIEGGPCSETGASWGLKKVYFGVCLILVFETKFLLAVLEQTHSVDQASSNSSELHLPLSPKWRLSSRGVEELSPGIGWQGVWL